MFCYHRALIDAPLKEACAWQHVRWADRVRIENLLNLLALQLEHGTDRSHRILRVLQESH